MSVEIQKWDEFKDRILSPEDKLLFEEASRAARAGALRAAYIVVWISCAESLKRKFKALALRDGDARRITGECQRKESAHQSVDHFLLDKSRDYGLITAAEFTRLEQTYVCRCLYGHPYELGPTEANLISAASDVVDMVLGKPTKLRHGYLSSQVDHLTSKGSFLDDTQVAVERFANEVAQKCDDSLHWWFLEKLWEKTEPISGDASLALFSRRSVWFTVAYLRQILAPLSKPWSAVTYLTRFKNTLSLALAVPDLFAALDPHSKDVVLGTMVENSRANLSILTILKKLADDGCLDARMRQRFQEAIDAREIEDLAAANIDPNLYVARIIKNLKSYNWYVQNPVMSVVKNLGAAGITSLTPAPQFSLGNNILQAADGGANGAVSFLTWATGPSHQWPVSFVDGIITECFINDTNQMRYKKDRLRDALTLLDNIEPRSVEELLERLIQRVRGGTIKPSAQAADRDEAVATLRDFAATRVQFSKQLDDLISVSTALAFGNPTAL